HLIRPHDDVPASRLYRSRQVARCGLVGGDGEGGAETTGPSAEARTAQRDAALVEDADVEGVRHGTRRLGRLVVRVGDVDLLDAGRYVDWEAHPVRGALIEVSGDRLRRCRAFAWLRSSCEMHRGKHDRRAGGSDTAEKGPTGGTARNSHASTLSDHSGHTVDGQ